MSSLQKTRSGYRIQFRIGQNTRQISLPDCKKKAAESVRRHIDELLASRLTGEPAQDHTREWVKKTSPEVRQRLVKLGLITQGTDRRTVVQLFDEFVKHRPMSDATHKSYQQTRQKLRLYFGERRPDSVTRGCVDDFRGFMSITLGLAENTIRKRCSQSSTFFKWLIRREILTVNPFDDVPKSVGDAKDQKPMISAADVERIIGQTADPEWQLLIALGRWGGLRVPSEPFAMRWEHVNWDHERLLIAGRKTKQRVIPLFPEIRPYLERLWAAPGTDAVWLFPRLRSGSGNVRTQFERLITRAGLVQWPNLWNSMRSTRETELASVHPIHVVCEWIGNSPAVARRHYLKVTDDDFAQALAAEPRRICAESDCTP